MHPTSDLGFFPSWFGQPDQRPGERRSFFELTPAEGAARDVQQACWMLRALRDRTGTAERDY